MPHPLCVVSKLWNQSNKLPSDVGDGPLADPLLRCVSMSVMGR